MRKFPEIVSDVQPRLDRLPWSGWHTKVVFALGFGWLLDSLEANIIGSVLGILLTIWHFTPLQGSLTVSVWLVGIMIGAVVFGYLSDRFGRKQVFLLTLLWYGSFTVACAFSNNIWVFIFLRFMAAVGIGGEYAAISSAVVEFIPKRVRGKTDAFDHVIMASWSTMLSVAGDDCAAIFPSGNSVAGGLLDCRNPRIICTLHPEASPESPRWLIERRRIEEAQAIVAAAERR